MSERRTEVKTFRVEYLCDTCGKPMRWNGMTLTSNPPWYPHFCLDCGVTESLREVYPKTEYEADPKEEMK